MSLPDHLDARTAAWWGLGAVLFGILVFVGTAFVGTFVLSLFVYYSTRPIYERLQGWIRPPSLAATTALLVIALPVLLLFGYTAALGLRELNGAVNSGTLESFRQLLRPYLDIAATTSELRQLSRAFVQDPEQFLSRSGVQQTLGQVVNTLARSLGILVTGILHLFLTFAIAFYLLRDGPKLAAWAEKVRITSGSVAGEYLQTVDSDLQTVFFGNILNAFLTGIIGAVTYSSLNRVAPPGVGIPAPILLGLLAGAASLIPVVGMKIVYVPVVIYLGGIVAVLSPSALWFPIAFALASFIVVDSIPDLVLRPYVSGRNLHVGTVMFAYVLGPLLFGWYGLFLGPLLLVVIVDFGRIVLPKLVRERPPGEAASSGTGAPAADETEAEQQAAQPTAQPAQDPPFWPRANGPGVTEDADPID